MNETNTTDMQALPARVGAAQPETTSESLSEVLPPVLGQGENKNDLPYGLLWTIRARLKNNLRFILTYLMTSCYY